MAMHRSLSLKMFDRSTGTSVGLSVPTSGSFRSVRTTWWSAVGLLPDFPRHGGNAVTELQSSCSSHRRQFHTACYTTNSRPGSLPRHPCTAGLPSCSTGRYDLTNTHRPLIRTQQHTLTQFEWCRHQLRRRRYQRRQSRCCCCCCSSSSISACCVGRCWRFQVRRSSCCPMPTFSVGSYEKMNDLYSSRSRSFGTFDDDDVSKTKRMYRWCCCCCHGRCHRCYCYCAVIGLRN